jgi:hypothetical protein
MSDFIEILSLMQNYFMSLVYFLRHGHKNILGQILKLMDMYFCKDGKNEALVCKYKLDPYLRKPTALKQAFFVSNTVISVKLHKYQKIIPSFKKYEYYGMQSIKIIYTIPNLIGGLMHLFRKNYF